MMLYGALVFNAINLATHINNGNLNQYFTPWSDPAFVTALLYLGIVSSIIAFLLSNYSLTYLEASKASVFANLATVVSIIMGTVFLKESFSINQIIGSLMILVGVFGTQYTNIMQAKNRTA
jgi:drug/metabolite transporter (DMT)-like permease